MTQTNYQLPPTKIMAWYKEQVSKGEVNRWVRHKLKHSVSAALITNWFLGYGNPKRPEQIEALSEVSGIPESELFEFVEEDEKH